MQFKWYGHSCFLLIASNGTRILTDPCAPSTGYRLHDIACDIVTSSHAHYDHNYFAAASGTPKRLSAEGVSVQGDLRITGIPSFHDGNGGAERGGNLIFLIEGDGLRVAHLGDLGHRLPGETVARIGAVDVLLCPIGGTYTIDARAALAVAEALRPRVLIPMHYQTDALAFRLDGVDALLQAAGRRSVRRLNDSVCRITPETLPQQDSIFVFSHAVCD